MFLYVNRKNETSISAYKSFGFAVTHSEVFDIGKGFVMDDFRMEKQIDL